MSQVNNLLGLLFGSPLKIEGDYDLANMDLCRKAARRFRESSDVVIKFECFNEAEARWFENYMSVHYPDIKFFTSALVFQK